MAIPGILERSISLLGLDTSSALVIITVVLGAVAVLTSYRSKGKLPPGPWGYPFIGHLPLLGKDPLETLVKFRKEYGDVYRIRFGKWPAIVINGKEAIKTAINVKGDVFNDRPEFLSIKLVRDMKGLTFGHFNARYIMQRKIGASALKMSTDSENEVYMDIVESEASYLVDELLSFEGKSFDPNESIYYAAGSIIFQVVYGKGKNIRKDEDFSWIVMHTKRFTDFVKAGNPFDALPWMRFILPNKFKLFSELMDTAKKAREKKLEYIRQTYDRGEMRHACDALITSTYQLSEDEKFKLGLPDDLILATAGDYIGAGFDTTATTLRWAFLLLASNPKVQEKVQKELDEVLGLSRRPSLADRSRLPFTEAMILEVLRVGSTVPLSLPHNTLEDTELLGYKIPQNTVVFLNLFSSNFDEQHWDSPQEFKPERFLDKEGKISRDTAENVLTFGVGRRRCLGEQVARMNIFMLLSFILQRCRIIKPQGEEYDFKGKLTLTHAPKPFKVQVVARG